MRSCIYFLFNFCYFFFFFPKHLQNCTPAHRGLLKVTLGSHGFHLHFNLAALQRSKTARIWCKILF